MKTRSNIRTSFASFGLELAYMVAKFSNFYSKDWFYSMLCENDLRLSEQREFRIILIWIILTGLALIFSFKESENIITDANIKTRNIKIMKIAISYEIVIKHSITSKISINIFFLKRWLPYGNIVHGLSSKSISYFYSEES